MDLGMEETKSGYGTVRILLLGYTILKIPRLAKGMKISPCRNLEVAFKFSAGTDVFLYPLANLEESLLRTGSSLIRPVFSVFSKGKKIRYVPTVLNQSFYLFLAGQTIEAVILGMLCTIRHCWILRLPDVSYDYRLSSEVYPHCCRDHWSL